MSMKLWRSITIYRTGGVVLECGSDEFSGRLRRMNIADARLRVAFQFSQRYANAFTMRFTHTIITAHKRSQRNGLRRGESRIPSGAVLRAGDLLAVFIFVGSGWLMLDELYAALRLLAFAQARKVRVIHRALQTPLTRKPSLPLAVPLSVAAPVILVFRSELARVVRTGLICGQRFGDSQHALQLRYWRGSIFATACCID